MSENTYTIHEYDHRFDAALAVMWNESDDQWPGTFTDGVPLNEERVREWMDRVDAIMQLIVVEEATGRIVGYGDLWDTAVRPGSCYVALLNVHPAHQGRSLARRVLVRMVDWAVAHGYDRITIGTWPANLKAMPLYKKVGFFWKPDTSVYMENYLPAVRLLPAAQKFFERHDWYCCYHRDLRQVEDDQKHPCTGDMDVYTLRWEANGDFLEAVFDRNAQALTGFETPEWAAYARTADSSPAKGLPYAFEWEIFNGGSRPLPVSLDAHGDEGIELVKAEDFVLAPGESRVLRARFQVNLDAPDFQGHHEDVPTPRVRTRLALDGTPLELGTGLRYQDAVEITTHPAAVSLVRGIPQEVLLQVRNRTRKPLQGVIRLELPEGLEADWSETPFQSAPEGYAGLPVTLTAHRNGFYPLEAAAVFEDAGETILLKPVRLPVAAPAPGRWAAGEGDKCLVLENDFFRITANEKAGEAVLWNRDTLREDARLMEEIGPPFVPWDLHEQQYDLVLKVTEVEARAVMTVRSTRFPGLVVGREIVVDGSPLVRVRGWVANNTDEAYEDLVLRPHVRIASEDQKMLTVPLVQGIVHEHSSQFGTVEEDLPKSPDGYQEEWVAYEERGRVLGMLWEKDSLKQVLGENARHFFLLPSPLAPGETRWGPPLYLYAGPGDWRAVQQAWRRLAGETRAEIAQSGAVRRHFDLNLAPRPLLSLGGELETALHVDTTRAYRLAGTVAVHPPAGWQTDFAERSFEADAGRALTTPLHFRPEPGQAVGVATGELVLADRVLNSRQPFRIVRIGDGDRRVTVEKDEAAGQTVYRIANEHSRWTVAPDFHGGITSWKTGPDGTDQLLTSFPDEGELDWMKPFFGGIRPVLFNPDGYGWPGKLHRETFEAAPARRRDANGFEWEGVRLEADVQAKAFRGLHLTLDYLTLPGSNVLSTVYRVANLTPVYRKLQHGWLAFARVDGSHQEARLHTEAYSRNRTPHHSWGVHTGWAAVENPETGRTLLAMHADPTKRLQAIDMGVYGAHCFVRQTVDVPPESAVEIAAFFILAEDLEQARQYADAGLKGLWTARD